MSLISPSFPQIHQTLRSRIFSFVRFGGAVAALCVIAASVPSSAQTLTFLHTFSDSDGYLITNPLTLGVDNNFYSTARQGGANGTGTVYKLTPSGGFTKLYNFGPRASESGIPTGALVHAASRLFYGVTEYGGKNQGGTVYSVTTSGKFKQLYNFTPAVGTLPGNLTALAGKFYGVANTGGSNNDGTVFEWTPTTGVKVLHTFAGTDGANPNGALTVGPDGALYGTTATGNGAFQYGGIFRITTAGVFTPLYGFQDANVAATPTAGLTVGADGALYGAAKGGMTPPGGDPAEDGYGCVFKVTTAGVFTLLYQFSGPDGKYPIGPLTLGPNNLLYGTTASGGKSNGTVATDYGTLFSLTSSGTLTTIYKFIDTTYGGNAETPVTFGPDGALYGIADTNKAYRLTLP